MALPEDCKQDENMGREKASTYIYQLRDQVVVGCK